MGLFDTVSGIANKVAGTVADVATPVAEAVTGAGIMASEGVTSLNRASADAQVAAGGVINNVVDGTTAAINNPGQAMENMQVVAGTAINRAVDAAPSIGSTIASVAEAASGITAATAAANYVMGTNMTAQEMAGTVMNQAVDMAPTVASYVMPAVKAVTGISTLENAYNAAGAAYNYVMGDGTAAPAAATPETASATAPAQQAATAAEQAAPVEGELTEEKKKKQGQGAAAQSLDSQSQDPMMQFIMALVAALSSVIGEDSVKTLTQMASNIQNPAVAKTDTPEVGDKPKATPAEPEKPVAQAEPQSAVADAAKMMASPAAEAPKVEAPVYGPALDPAMLSLTETLQGMNFNFKNASTPIGAEPKAQAVMMTEDVRKGQSAGAGIA